jgi:hypothetical protein
MRSHFRISSSAAIACAVSGATALMTGVCTAQVASDSASDPIYSGGWSAGQNGGTGFGAWSFNGSDPAPGASYQSISTGSALGTAWTLSNTNSGSGLANAGRSITGGLLAGEMFQAVIQNPVNNAGIYTYRGFDILFTSGTDNNAGGNNTAALRLSVFDYYNAAMNWHINDTGSVGTTVSAITTGASAMLVDLLVGPGGAYNLTLAPESNPNSPYLSYSGTLASSIDYVDFRNYNTASTGPNDTADNLSIGSMAIVVPEPSPLMLSGLGAISFMLYRRRK